MSASLVEPCPTVVPAAAEEPALPGPLVRAGAFGNATGLSCRECGHRTPLGPHYACTECFGPLEVAYDFPAVTRERIEAGPPSIWRYQAAAPGPRGHHREPEHRAGLHPAGRADNLRPTLGLDSLWVKDDSTNPTHSFKDRVVAVRPLGGPRVRLEGLRLPLDREPRQRRGRRRCPRRHQVGGLRPGQPRAPQAGLTPRSTTDQLVAVNGTYDDVNQLATEIAAEEEGWAFVNVNVRPYLRRGLQDAGVRDRRAARLAAARPGGDPGRVRLAADQDRQGRSSELIKLGLVEDKPYGIFGAQATGCSPVAQALSAGQEVVRPVKPDTIAKSLAIGNPADGPYVLDICRRTGGAIEDVSDDEVREGIILLARTEGHLHRDRGWHYGRCPEEARGRPVSSTPPSRPS